MLNKDIMSKLLSDIKDCLQKSTNFDDKVSLGLIEY